LSYSAFHAGAAGWLTARNHPRGIAGKATRAWFNGDPVTKRGTRKQNSHRSSASL